jgi:hypothetical protein
MEKNIIAKINKNSSELKKNMIDWIKKNNVNISDDTGRDKTNEFIEHISDFPTIQLTKDDFKRRTRIKTVIPNYERCCALRLNGDRCTRKKKDKEEFCGTHLKGKPYGIIEETQALEKNKTAIWVEDIGGIHQYIDADGNIYSTEDILQSVKHPRIIGKK